MTLNQLIQAAAQRRLIQWFPSGVVEQVFLLRDLPELRPGYRRYLRSQGVVVLAEAPLGSKGLHPIYPKYGRDYRFRLVDPSESIQLRYLLPKKDRRDTLYPELS